MSSTLLPTHYQLPPPNEGAVNLCNLRHGRQDYEVERLAYSQQLQAYYHDKSLPHPPPWQPSYDKHAGWLVCNFLPGVHDEVLKNFLTPEGTYLRYLIEPLQAWNPDDFQQALFTSPAIVQGAYAAVKQSSRYDLPRSAINTLSEGLADFFYTGYKEIFFDTHRIWQDVLASSPEMLTSIKDRYDFLFFPVETQWQWAKQSFRLAVNLVSMWCVANVGEEPYLWAELFARHVNFTDEFESQHWKDIVAQAAMVDDPFSSEKNGKPKPTFDDIPFLKVNNNGPNRQSSELISPISRAKLASLSRSGR